MKEYSLSLYKTDYPDIQCQEPVMQIRTCPGYRDKGVEPLVLSIQYHTCHRWGSKLSMGKKNMGPEMESCPFLPGSLLEKGIGSSRQA